MLVPIFFLALLPKVDSNSLEGPDLYVLDYNQLWKCACPPSRFTWRLIESTSFLHNRQHDCRERGKLFICTLEDRQRIMGREQRQTLLIHHHERKDQSKANMRDMEEWDLSKWSENSQYQFYVQQLCHFYDTSQNATLNASLSHGRRKEDRQTSVSILGKQGMSSLFFLGGGGLKWSKKDKFCPVFCCAWFYHSPSLVLIMKVKYSKHQYWNLQ